MSARARTRARSSGHGGSRRGSGRKPAALPSELAALIPNIRDAIANPIKLARYYTTLLGLLTDVRVRGGANAKSIDKLAREVRANVTAAGKIIPADIQFAAAQMLKNDDDDMKRDKGPQQEKRDSSKTSNPVRASEA